MLKRTAIWLKWTAIAKRTAIAKFQVVGMYGYSCVAWRRTSQKILFFVCLIQSFVWYQILSSSGYGYSWKVLCNVTNVADDDDTLLCGSAVCEKFFDLTDACGNSFVLRAPFRIWGPTPYVTPHVMPLFRIWVVYTKGAWRYDGIKSFVFQAFWERTANKKKQRTKTSNIHPPEKW